MMKWIAPGFGSCAAAVILAALWQAGAATPQTPVGVAASAEISDWGSPDGGAVVLKPNGTYSVLVTDVSDNSSLFSEGRVVARRPNPDGGVTYVLKPTTPSEVSWTLEVVAKPDGTAELYVTRGGVRHLACPLKH